jgi:adenylate kinase/nucleoside 2-deoxyribosyltransferase
MKKWIVTGVSGSDRIEFLREIQDHCQSVLGKKVHVHDVGSIMKEEAQKANFQFIDDKILDVDQSALRLLRANAAKEVSIRMTAATDYDLHLIGFHATFRWKGRLLPAMSYADVFNLNPDGFINVVDDVKEVHSRNSKNRKWDKETLPGIEKTQEWMIEEEFATEILADVLKKPMILVARQHHPSNIADLFFSSKKKIYLSYPITAVKEDNPDLLKKVQGEILDKLEAMFVVFDPLAIKDMSLTYPKAGTDFPELLEQLTPEAIQLIKSRTIERDFQFIDQSDAVVVFYLTDKVSPGVLAEIYYAFRNEKPVFICFNGKTSPFLELAVTNITSTIEKQMELLQKFAGQGGA